LFTLSAAVFFYGGWPFLKGFAGELGKRRPGMMTLIALAVSVAFVYSWSNRRRRRVRARRTWPIERPCG
jgi:cation transport ATPase